MLFMGRSLCPHELNQFSSFQCFSQNCTPSLAKSAFRDGPMHHSAAWTLHVHSPACRISKVAGVPVFSIEVD